MLLACFAACLPVAQLFRFLQPCMNTCVNNPQQALLSCANSDDNPCTARILDMNYVGIITASDQATYRHVPTVSSLGSDSQAMHCHPACEKLRASERCT